MENPKSQRQESQWKSVSIALQGLPQRNLHQLHAVREMAPSRMLVLQDREWVQIWREVLSCASPGRRNRPAKGLKRMVTKVQ